LADAEFDGFEWDAEKSARCLSERGFDFDYVTKIFGEDFIEWTDRRREYGEERLVTVGAIDGRAFAVVWTPRGSTRRIISARPASRLEREQLHGHRETQ
jgi:uncharacterized DUF497 family protein